eukprot:5253223-Prymnesium_polylepis.1
MRGLLGSRRVPLLSIGRSTLTFPSAGYPISSKNNGVEPSGRGRVARSLQTRSRVVRWPMAYDAPGGGIGRYARPA